MSQSISYVDCIAFPGYSAYHRLSGMSQSVGYLLAAIGPILLGSLRDVTNSWSLSLLILILNCIVLFAVGMCNRQVELNRLGMRTKS
ncbi:MAG TPA: hypothetical protein VK085_13985 [Pseudogracilibacillus sp.]|nr:hypothetical protein [Pseudogracilibacillus sp.]